MNCKNCGARLRDNAKVCPNCGAFVDDESGYTLLAADDRYDDVYSSSERAYKGRNRFRAFLAVFLILAVVFGGAYFYFTKINPKTTSAPALTFETGSGLINRNEAVIYVSLPKGSNIEYIHGVSLYLADELSEGKVTQNSKALSEAYDYTKSIDSTFRSVFFDTEPLKLEDGKEYTVVFSMKFSFVGSAEQFGYTAPLTFKAGNNTDVSDIVFDHSMTGETSGDDKNASGSEETAKQAEAPVNADFIYDGYWFTQPQTNDNVRSISSFKFSKDRTCTITDFDKTGDEDFKVSAEESEYKIDGDSLIILLDGVDVVFKLDAEKETIFEEADGQTTQTLTKRNYNSIKNAEDFFGI